MRPTLAAIAMLLLTPVASAAGTGRAAQADSSSELASIGWLPTDVFEAGDGLPDPTINAVASLPNGQVWVGTMRGLGRMHGARFVAEPGPTEANGKAILDLATTPRGELLAAVDGGPVLRLHNGRLQTLGAPFRKARTHRLRVFADAGPARIFATGAGGVAEWTGQRWQPHALPQEAAEHTVFDVALQPARGNRKEILWVGTFGAGLYRCERGAPCQPMRMPDTGPRTDEVRVLQLQPRNGAPPILWAGLYGGGIARIDGEQVTRWHTGNSELPSDFISALQLVPEASGTTALWVGTRSGLTVLRGDAQWQRADPRVPMLRERIRSLAVTATSQGAATVWVGTDSGAARVPQSGRWRLVSTAGQQGNGIWGIHVERTSNGKQQVWLGSDGEGLLRHDGERWYRYGRADGLADASVRSILRVRDGLPGGSLWVGSWGARIARLVGNRFIAVATPWTPREDDVVSLLLADGDAVWASTRYQGLARWQDGRWQSWAPDARMPARAYAAVRHGQDVWISSVDRGLLRYRNGQWRIFREDIGLPRDALYDLRLIPGGDGRPILWAGSGGNNMLRIDISNPDRPTLVTQPALPVLPIPLVYGAVQDGRGDILVCSDYGVFSWQETASGYRSTAYHREDGLPHDECNGNALQVDDRGRVWIGTVGGAAVYIPAEPAQRKPSPLLLTGARVDGAAAKLKDGVLVLPRAGSSLDLHYQQLTGEDEGQSRYRVRLPGEAGSWTHDTSHAFSRLPSGRQRVLIEAEDFAGVASAPLALTVEVPYLWWQTPLARALMVLAALGLFWLVLRLRVRSLSRHENQLRQMVQQRTTQLQERESELRRANDELRRLSYTDPLTGLGNRRRLFEALALHCRACAERQRPLGVLLIDLDHFKAYNDTHGHIAGDSCLQDVARRLQAGLPHDALATRYGGEEFCLVLPGMDTERASALAERLRQSIQAMSVVDAGHGAPAVTASIGVVAQVPHGADCADALLSCADGALYQAKEGGRNRVQLAGG